MIMTIGTLVEHASFGRGKVVETKGANLVIHFPKLAGTEQGARRLLKPATPQLTIAENQIDPAFDKIQIGPPVKRKASKAGPNGPRRSTVHTLEQAIAWFQTTYPGLFESGKLVDDELRYKREAHQRWVTLFGHGRGSTLLQEEEYEAICAALDDVHHRTNIPSRFETMAAHDGYKDRQAAAAVLRSTLDFIERPAAETFDRMVAAISDLPAPAGGARVLTWPNATILPFLADPTMFMVVKPQITQLMASRINTDILYSSQVTWHCYENVLKMSAVLLERLKPLGAKDYIDVQSFMWVTQDLA